MKDHKTTITMKNIIGKKKAEIKTLRACLKIYNKGLKGLDDADQKKGRRAEVEFVFSHSCKCGKMLKFQSLCPLCTYSNSVKSLHSCKKVHHYLNQGQQCSVPFKNKS